MAKPSGGVGRMCMWEYANNNEKSVFQEKKNKLEDSNVFLIN